MPKVNLKLFASTKEKILLGVILFMILTVPVGAFTLSQTILKPTEKQNFNLFPVTDSPEKKEDSPLDKLKKELDKSKSDYEEYEDSGSKITDTASLILGPSLHLKIAIEGRPQGRNATRLFLGLAAGIETTKPKYLLSFTINIPETGVYKDLSLAGLEEGKAYTAYLKGQAQIASASAFTIKPTGNDLGTVNMITGDINDDNTINTADYSILKAALGKNSSASDWNSNLDFNLDQVINTLDLSILVRNMGKTGASGVWQSGIPVATQSATISGSLKPNIGGLHENNDPREGKGYWIWVPKMSN